MPTASTTGPIEQVADADRAAEAHHPQRHDPAPHVLVHAGLQRRVQGGDEREVEGARDGHVDVRRARGCAAARTRTARANSRRGRPAPAGAWTSGRRPSRWRWRRPGRRRRSRRRGSRSRRLGQVDPEVVGRHHRHLPDEGERQQREQEHGDQAPADHLVLAGHRDAGRQLAPAAGLRGRLRARRAASPSSAPRPRRGRSPRCRRRPRPARRAEYSTPPMTGPMTRDAFIWAEFSEIARAGPPCPRGPGRIAE